MRNTAAALSGLAPLASCATTPSIPPEVRAQLAPTGTLRAGINHANAIVATKDPNTGELRGVSVDFVREVGRRLDVPVELHGFDFSGKLADAMNAGALDIGGIGGGSGTGREAGLKFLRDFIDEAKASGFVAHALVRSGHRNVPVSPPAK